MADGISGSQVPLPNEALTRLVLLLRQQAEEVLVEVVQVFQRKQQVVLLPAAASFHPSKGLTCLRLYRQAE